VPAPPELDEFGAVKNPPKKPVIEKAGPSSEKAREGVIIGLKHSSKIKRLTKAEREYLEATRKAARKAKRAADLAQKLEDMANEPRKVFGPFSPQDERDLEDIKPLVADAVRAILNPYDTSRT